MKFYDFIYGKIEIPKWLVPFIKTPEFSRLRGVRLSNVDSIEFKDFNNIRRWEHCIAVAHLALVYARQNRLSKVDEVHLTLAALFHDIATPPFAHTVEYVIDNYNHEVESQKILDGKDEYSIETIFNSEQAKFNDVAKIISKELGFTIRNDEVASYIVGEGKFGHLIKGSIDLDNIDNVIRASLLMGIEVDKTVPYNLVKWLSNFDSAPALDNRNEEYVKSWIDYRNKMYSMFYHSTDEEQGRQAFLQHIIRRALTEGFPRKRIIWNTDETLLSDLKTYFNLTPRDHSLKHRESISELVDRYSLLEEVHKIIEIPIHNIETFQSFKNPLFGKWLENILGSPSFEPFVVINKARFNSNKSNTTLFEGAIGSIIVFKLGTATIKRKQLPAWLKEKIPKDTKDSLMDKLIHKALVSQLNDWNQNKPWLSPSESRKVDIKENLESVGDWSFKLSRNKSIHSYPATYVHAIPANLILSLGLKGERIWDPFGGTGQTATEAIKMDCTAISSDSNRIATLAANTKFTFYSNEDLDFLSNLNINEISNHKLLEDDCFEKFEKWHHLNTYNELSRIKKFIDDISKEEVALFLTNAFSDILTECTERRGKQHGYFADNTPLPREKKSPTYVSATDLFAKKVKRNLKIINDFYSQIERNDLDIQSTLLKANTIQHDIKNSTLPSVISAEPIAGIITSPPYLCMADYTLGQRLSYYWLFPDDLSNDFELEIGTRRSRSNSTIALKKYLSSMEKFAINSNKALRIGGYLATVIGAPVANSFEKVEIFKNIDKIFLKEGFELVWEKFRPIHWHRNHGYARLKYERIAVYVKRE